jgi:endonuclease YncB( thermonuclease family)
MVEAGWAWAYIRYSVDYLGLEILAAGAGLGVHRHQCERPDLYRHRAPPRAR